MWLLVIGGAQQTTYLIIYFWAPPHLLKSNADQGDKRQLRNIEVWKMYLGSEPMFIFQWGTIPAKVRPALGV